MLKPFDFQPRAPTILSNHFFGPEEKLRRSGVSQMWTSLKVYLIESSLSKWPFCQTAKVLP
jgi:hypothetical protein